MLEWDRLCAEHGGLSHAVVHESGHAVVAVKLGFAFEHVSINPIPVPQVGDPTHLVGGGVEMSSETLRELVQTRPVASLQFCLAGALAEHAAFAHSLDQSFRGDLNLWRNYAGLVKAQDEYTLEAALGERFENIVRSTKELIVKSQAAIRLVARLLGERETLTHRDVRGAVRRIGG